MFRYLLSLLLFIEFSHVQAQEPDKLITITDTTNVHLKISMERGNYIVSFKKNYEDFWHELYAENALAAIIPGKSLFLSVKLPDTKKNVWAKCIFEGIFSLLEYKRQYYVSVRNEIVKLDPPESTGAGKNTSKNRYIGLMILIFGQDIDYYFNNLKYSSKSLVKPFIKYHEEKNLPYKDYNLYTEVDHLWMASAGITADVFTLRTADGAAIDLNTVGASTGIGFSFSFPEFLNRLSFSSGMNCGFSSVNDLIVSSEADGRTNYYDISFQTVRPEITILASYDFVKKEKFLLSLGTGLKAIKLFPTEKKMKIETLENNVVQTNFTEIETAPGAKVMHYSELSLKIPALSKFVSVGLSYSMSLQKTSSVQWRIDPDNSLAFFARLFF
ncbi:MAG: hypothetical protein ABFD10_11205 [Prolixibacteraceae bacterium]